MDTDNILWTHLRTW